MVPFCQYGLHKNVKRVLTEPNSTGLRDVEAPGDGAGVLDGAVDAEDVGVDAHAPLRQLLEGLAGAGGEGDDARRRRLLELVVGDGNPLHRQRRVVVGREVDQDLRLAEHAALGGGRLQLDDGVARALDAGDRRVVLDVAAPGVLRGEDEPGDAREHGHGDDQPAHQHAPPRLDLRGLGRGHEIFGSSGAGNAGIDIRSNTITLTAARANAPLITSEPSPAMAATTAMASNASRASTLPADRRRAPRANTSCSDSTSIKPMRRPHLSSERPAT